MTNTRKNKNKSQKKSNLNNNNVQTLPLNNFIARLDKQDETMQQLQQIITALSEKFSSLNTRPGSIESEPHTNPLVPDEVSSPPPEPKKASKGKQPVQEKLLRIEDLQSKEQSILRSVMGKDDSDSDDSSLPVDSSMFINFSNKKEEDSDDDRLGSVARVLSKELKTLGKASKKHKLKEAKSFAEWQRVFNKRVASMESLDGIKRYLLFVETVNNINRYKSWPVARAYAWIWLKKDSEAAKKSATGGFSNPPEAASIVQDFFIRAEMKAAKSSKEDKGSSSIPKKSSFCFACGATGHFAKACTTPCSVCGVPGHNAARCFQAPAARNQVRGAPQPGQSNPLGGPVLMPASAPLLPTPIVCGKCKQQGHSAAQCNMR